MMRGLRRWVAVLAVVLVGLALWCSSAQGAAPGGGHTHPGMAISEPAHGQPGVQPVVESPHREAAHEACVPVEGFTPRPGWRHDPSFTALSPAALPVCAQTRQVAGIGASPIGKPARAVAAAGPPGLIALGISRR